MRERVLPAGLASAEVTAIAGVLALLPRLYVAIAWAREPVWDGHYYDFGARRIAQGLGYSADRATDLGLVWQPWCHYPVGYSGFLGGVYAVFGDGPSVAPVANAIVGAILVCLVHRLALRLTTPVRALIAAALVALSPVLVAYTPLLMTEPLAAAGLVAAPLAYLSLRERTRAGAAGIAGAILGLVTLVRPQSAICAPALALLAWRDVASSGFRERARRAAAVAAIATGACLAVVAPWTARNCRVMDGCAVVSTNGGWNLAIGASPRATGRFEALHGSDGCREVTGQVQQDRCWQRQGLAWIRAEPARWLALVPKKLGFTFDHQSFAVGYLGEADPTAWPEPRRATFRKWLAVTGRALLVAAALGTIGLIARPWRVRVVAPRVIALAIVIALALGAAFGETFGAWPLAVAIPLAAIVRRHVGPGLATEEARGLYAYLAFLVGSTCVVHAIFFGEDRYQIVVVPALALLASLALSFAPAQKGSEPVARDV
jgi:4-amino-4-deoxy-L-arabinose transferase-like glycosyltransferase